MVRSEWIAYLDDDALPYPDWTARALEVARRPPDGVGLIGGAVLPQWPVQMKRDSVEPSRLGDRWRTLLSLIDVERTEPGSQVPNIVSCNMLVRRFLLDEIGGFPTDLGRTPGTLLGGEDIAVARRVAAHGWRVAFERRLRVYHRIHAERLGTDWVRRRAQAEGELLWKVDSSAATAAKVLLSIPWLALVARLRELPYGIPSNYDYHVRFWNNIGFVKSALKSIGRKPPQTGVCRGNGVE